MKVWSNSPIKWASNFSLTTSTENFQHILLRFVFSMAKFFRSKAKVLGVHDRQGMVMLAFIWKSQIIKT